ncbi:MAG: hypothetical protein CSB13_12005 [Chloroflexi bacterium]|nr:MAG: hypothetical protein CSB13_12005 [Chloroflexota bacterium]
MKSVWGLGVWGLLIWLMVACQTERWPLATPTPTATAVSIQLSAADNQQSLPATNTPVTSPTSVPTPLPTTEPITAPTIPATFTPGPTPSPKPTQHFYEPLEITPAGTAVPPPRPQFPKDDNITNIVLLGNDGAESQSGRTDSIVIVSINQDTKTASMLSIPRDLYVYIPGWKMTKINLALSHGHGVDYAHGGGGGLIKDTIAYNLGIPIDYYARIGFDGFKEVIDILGGIEIVANCSLRDWRLKSPELDPNIEENWEQFILEPGIHQMDGDFALWYARSRRTTNDFERGRRQQQLLQAIFNQGLQQDTLVELPELWHAYKQVVETDLTLPILLQLATLAPAVRENGIQHYAIAGEAVRSWREPETRWSMQLLNWENAEPILRQVMVPPQLSRGQRNAILVEVETYDDVMYRQMAENLIWFGFEPRHIPWSSGDIPAFTTITYYGPNFKGSYNELLSWLFHQEPSQVALADQATGDFYYRVVLGRDANPCLDVLYAPRGNE